MTPEAQNGYLPDTENIVPKLKAGYAYLVCGARVRLIMHSLVADTSSS
jgi:hypothetical protein